MVVKVRYVRSAPVTNTLAQVREKSPIFPHTYVMFAPVTHALDTLLTYVAVQGYLALRRYTYWVWGSLHLDVRANDHSIKVA